MSINLSKEAPDFILSLNQLRRGPYEIFLLDNAAVTPWSKALLRIVGSNDYMEILFIDIDNERNSIYMSPRGIGNYSYEFSFSDFLKLFKEPGSISGKCTLIPCQDCGECVLTTSYKQKEE